MPVFKEMLNSNAWACIGHPAKVAYIHIKAKCFSQDSGDLTLSYIEMERIMTKQTFARALRQLEQFGFIERTQRGGLFRRRNYFRLIEKWKNNQVQVGKVTPIQVSKVPLVSINRLALK